MAAPACLSCCQSGVSTTRPARLSRIVLVAWRTLRRSWESLTAVLAFLANSGPPAPSVQIRSPVLDREGPAEPTALLVAWERDQVDAADVAQQSERAVANLEDPERMASGVVGHPV